MRRRVGDIQKKIMLMLLGGFALGLSRSPRTSFKIISDIKKEWKQINESRLRRSILSLYKSKLVHTVRNADGSITLTLSDNGKDLALSYDLSKLKLNVPEKWDRKWRIVTFDIPERLRVKRDTARFHLKDMGFIEFQKSVFIHPSDCRKELEFLIEYLKVRQYLRFIIADYVDNAPHLKTIFKISC